jgi:hypothetical protein
MNVEIGAEAALFLEKESISGIFVAVRAKSSKLRNTTTLLFILQLGYSLSYGYAEPDGDTRREKHIIGEIPRNLHAAGSPAGEITGELPPQEKH